MVLMKAEITKLINSEKSEKRVLSITENLFIFFDFFGFIEKFTSEPTGVALSLNTEFLCLLC